jgi:hypothetical protein
MVQAERSCLSRRKDRLHHDRAETCSRDFAKRAVELRCVPYHERYDLQPDGFGCGAHLFQERSGEGIGGAREHGNRI